jgi:hypothetical protein
MEPEVAATGHGIPMHGTELRRQLAEFVPRFDTLARPKTGRYVHQPATADGSGVTSVPPPVVKPWLKGVALAGLALGAVALATAGNGKKKSKGKKRKGSRSGESPAPSQARTPDGSYRAWYRDNPAQTVSTGPDWQDRRPGAYSDQKDYNQHPEPRYSDQSSRRIETQYP